MTFSEADALCGEVAKFLISSGGPYKKITGDLQRMILEAIATDQYVIFRKDGKINCFASYWRVHPRDLNKAKENIKPEDVTTGSVMFVTECAGKGMVVPLVKELRRRGKGMKGFASLHHKFGFRYFPEQRGDQ